MKTSTRTLSCCFDRTFAPLFHLKMRDGPFMHRHFPSGRRLRPSSPGKTLVLYDFHEKDLFQR